MGKRILIKLNPVGEYKTEGGVILPAAHSENTRIGIVISIGDEVDKFKEKDKILIAFHSGTVIDLPTEEMSAKDDTVRMINQENIIAKLEKE